MSAKVKEVTMTEFLDGITEGTLRDPSGPYPVKGKQWHYAFINDFTHPNFSGFIMVKARE